MTITGDRAWSTLTTVERDYIQLGPGQLADRCRAIGAHYHSAYNALERRGVLPKRPVQVSPSTARVYTDYLYVEGNALVLPDPHVPYYSHELINKACGLAQAWGIENVVFAGDEVDCTDLSSFRRDVPANRVGQEIGAWRELLQQVASGFTNVYVLIGNHDARLLHLFYSSGMTWEDFVAVHKLPPNVTLSEYHYMVLLSGGDEWRITHPDQASKSMAEGLANKYEQHIVMAHSHKVGVTRNISGRFTVIESGGVFDPLRLSYVCLMDSNKNTPLQGFVIIRNGYGYLFDPGNCDWEWWKDAVQKEERQETLCTSWT